MAPVGKRLAENGEESGVVQTLCNVRALMVERGGPVVVPDCLAYLLPRGCTMLWDLSGV